MLYFKEQLLYIHPEYLMRNRGMSRVGSEVLMALNDSLLYILPSQCAP